mmetsp:Transcript_41293/g.97913  ORF Transcript_41293/g.97913 Transcript_41293/m.97913 type:complete len:228 (+) Transcript_41293:183-866(+)
MATARPPAALTICSISKSFSPSPIASTSPSVTPRSSAARTTPVALEHPGGSTSSIVGIARVTEALSPSVASRSPRTARRWSSFRSISIILYTPTSPPRSRIAGPIPRVVGSLKGRRMSVWQFASRATIWSSVVYATTVNPRSSQKVSSVAITSAGRSRRCTVAPALSHTSSPCMNTPGPLSAHPSPVSPSDSRTSCTHGPRDLPVAMTTGMPRAMVAFSASTVRGES